MLFRSLRRGRRAASASVSYCYFPLWKSAFVFFCYTRDLRTNHRPHCCVPPPPTPRHSFVSLSSSSSSPFPNFLTSLGLSLSLLFLVCAVSILFPFLVFCHRLSVIAGKPHAVDHCAPHSHGNVRVVGIQSSGPITSGLPTSVPRSSISS